MANHRPALKIVSPEEDGSSENVEAEEERRSFDPDGFLAGLSPDMRSSKILELVVDELDLNKAEDVVQIDLNGKTEIADTMVICSGRSQRHVGAVAEKVISRLKEAGLRGVRAEGQSACDWVLIDAEDVVVHLFRPEVRSFYNLERIWSEEAHGDGTPSGHLKDPSAPSASSSLEPSAQDPNI
ncbi:MAG: ribosome silencing factor [Pseudomonadota bacterium]